MNDLGGFPVNLVNEDELLKRLSHLQPFTLPNIIDSQIEENLLRDTANKYRRKRRPGLFLRKRGIGHWEPVLILILFFLLGWDLLRIIQLLLH